MNHELSTGCATPKAASLHPRLQPAAPLGRTTAVQTFKACPPVAGRHPDWGVAAFHPAACRGLVSAVRFHGLALPFLGQSFLGVLGVESRCLVVHSTFRTLRIPIPDSRIPAPESRRCVSASWREAAVVASGRLPKWRSPAWGFSPGRPAAAATTYCAFYNISLRL